MNLLKMDIQQAISTLSRSGRSQRRIARKLGIDRETVARYRRLDRQGEEPKPAIPPAESEGVPEASPAPALTGAPARSRRQSQSAVQNQPFRSPAPRAGAS